MLHSGDRNLVLQRDNDPSNLYRMDLETGKVVDEWKVHDDIPVNIYAPENKFAQKTDEQTFLGLSKNALYRIDPRLSGSKLVDSELKQYVSKNDFSAAATTEQGYIAVASNKGDIRMFDRLGINAKDRAPCPRRSDRRSRRQRRWSLGPGYDAHLPPAHRRTAERRQERRQTRLPKSLRQRQQTATPPSRPHTLPRRAIPARNRRRAFPSHLHTSTQARVKTKPPSSRPLARFIVTWFLKQSHTGPQGTL